jgi:WD40 repeat protein
MTASSRGKVVIWDTETGKPVIETIEHPRDRPDPIDIERNEFSPDGSLLLTASTDHTVRLWDTTTGLPISRPLVHADEVNQAHFSPDGKRVATASNDNTARLWNVETGLPITPPLQHADDVLKVVFSAEGRRLATTSRNQDARVWDAITGKPLTGYLEHNDQVTAISFSADGQFVATGCIDGNVRLWSVGSGKLHGPLMPHPGEIQFVEFHPDGRHLLTTSRPAAGADGTEARIWDLAANKPRSLLLEGTDARHAQFIPNSTHALVADQEHRLRVHETKNGSLTIEPVKTSGDIHHFEFNEQGTKLITATAAGIARVWDTASLKPLTPPMQNKSPVYFAHFNHDDSQLVTITKDDAVRAWNTNSGTQLAEIFDGTGPYESLDAVFHPDGQLITFRRHHERFDTSLLPVQTWAIGEGGILKPGTLKLDTREAFQFKEVSQASLNPRGDQLLVITNRQSAYEEGFTANVFDTATAKKIAEIPYDEDFYGASFSDNGKRLLIYTKTRARVWDTSDGKPVSPWIRTGGRIQHAIFSPNGLLVGTASQLSDSQGSTWGTACIWDARSGQPLTTKLVHDKPVMAIDFSTDSSQLLTRADAVRLWQIGPTPHSLDKLTSITQFLSSARLDETATLQPLTTEQQRKSWQAAKENSSIDRIGTDQQATMRRRELYGLAIREDDLLALRRHQDILIQAEPKSTNLLWHRSLTAASLGDLDTTVTDLRKLTTLVPDDNCYYSANYVMMLLRQGDTAAFRRECQSLLKRYNDTTDAMIAERVAKTCCLEPVQFPIDDIRIQLAGRAADAGDSNPFYAWAHLAYGMASYRTGQVELALEQLKPLGDMTKPLPPNFTMPGKVLAKFFVAMSEHQLDNHEEAERALQIALKYNRARGNIQNIPDNVYDWVRCDIIESEALSLIRERPANSP